MLLFDLMDTLLVYEDEDAPYWWKAALEVEAAGLMRAREFDERFAKTRSRRLVDGGREVSIQEILRELLPEAAGDGIFLETLIARCREEYRRRTRPHEGVEAMLRRWHGVVPMAVVSNFYIAGFPEELVTAHNLDSYFAFVIDSTQVGYRKPAPEIFDAALKRAGIHPSQRSKVWFIGDNWRADVEGAVRAGMTPIYFSKEEGPDPTVRRISSWDDLTAPDGP